ncbi:S8 family serine peptidase [bacterium]|nr:S8 family serine peptidase [candidate division CSSED10-310 bacterium]
MRKALFVILLSGFSLISHAQWVPGEVLVKLAPAALIETDVGGLEPLQAVLNEWQKCGVSGWQTLCQAPDADVTCDLDRWFVVTASNGKTDQQLLDALQSLASVETSSLNYYVYMDEIPNDPDFNKQFALPLMEAPAAWDVIKGNSSVVVAIIDSGTDLTHPDLASAIWINPGEIPGNGIDDDGNTYIDDTQGWDFDGNDNNPNYGNAVNDHGTHVSGIVSAITNNGIGVAGGTWGCPIMILKVFPDSGGGAAVGNVAAAIRYAADNGALVANLSLGSGSNFAIQEEAVEYAYTAGVTIVAAAGNGGNDGIGDSTPHYPSANEGVIGVGNTNRFDSKDGSSNYGEDYVDVYAPGVSIRSTLPGGNYGNLGGTSMSSPMAAALAALIKCQNPSFTPDEILERMQKGCDAIDYSNPAYRGLLDPGRINYFLSLAETPVIRIEKWLIDDSTGNSNFEADVGETVSMELMLKNHSWMDATNVNVTISASSGVTISSAGASYPDIQNKVTRSNLTDFIFTVTESSRTTIPIQVDITADGGYSETATFDLSVNNPFPQMQWFPVPSFGGFNASARAADINNDGFAEIITASNDGTISVFNRNGGYYHGWPVSIASQIYLDSNLILAAPAVADIDGDGDVEIIVADQLNNVAWVNPNDPNQGTKSRVLGRINVFTNDGLPFGGAWPFVTDIPFSTGDPVQAGFKCSPCVADVAGDDRLEIIAGNYDNKVYVFDCMGNVLSGWPQDVGTDVFASASTFDFDDDGKCEILIATKDDIDPLDSGAIYLFNGSGQIQPGYPVAAPNQVYSVPALADLDSDGVPEIIYGYGDYANEIGPKGVMVTDILTSPLPGWPVTVPASIYGAPAIGDLDQDTIPEIVICTIDSYIYAFHTDGTGVTGFPVQVSTNANSVINSSPAIADIDSDGYPEILVCSEIGNQTEAWLHIYHSNGTVLTNSPIMLAGSGFSSPCVADIDNDGDTEIIIADTTTSVFNLSTTLNQNQLYWTTYHADNRSTGVYPEETPLKTGVNMMLTGDMFNAGKAFSLEAILTNASSTPVYDIDLFVILDVYSMYWFAPSWSQTADWEDIAVLGGQETLRKNIMTFTWPAVEGSADNLIFWGGMLGSDVQLVGDIDFVTFGYEL